MYTYNEHSDYNYEFVITILSCHQIYDKEGYLDGNATGFTIEFDERSNKVIMNVTLTV